ncbi:MULTISPECIES: 3-dehydroquinate synthase family protein [unclassified Exiguobacterium]|uniref:3-dehydroquinate synthase n=1 Tax=unclassified Exiguobacterium TaxID=2644629 RepID=UPI001BE9C4A7|nr:MULTISPECIES: 3-dehydroquinate synthase family protein [unclassified Exiguobacterium]
MVTIPITASTPYNVVVDNEDRWIGTNDWSHASMLWVITDEHVDSLYGESFLEKLKHVHSRVVWSVVEAGDASKSLSRLDQLVSEGLRHGCDRHTLIIAFGGGMVGDLAGFLASVYMRGVPYIQVPTTILAHDSAVGGKVAVNHPLAKNAIGSFYQPVGVYYNVSRFETLPVHEVRSGIGELLKHAYLSRYVLESSFEDDLFFALTGLVKIDWITWLARGIEVKRAIVETDEREQGIRAWLNFGHTFGHALESVEAYRIPHGEAVLHGMVFAFLLSNDESRARRLFEWIRMNDVTPIDWKPFDHYVEKMTRDKKNRHGEIRFVLLRDSIAVEAVPLEQIQHTFEQMKGWWER